jgi:heat shock protein HtpX
MIYLTTIFIVFFMFFQWLFSPKFINAIYKVDIIKAPTNRDEEWLVHKIRELSSASGLKNPPKVGIARGLKIPNAFAYSSPIYGMHVAVTPSLLDNMPKDELEAVLAHEVGHLKHKDVVAMLAVSFIPILIYYLGRHLMFLSVFGYGARDRDRGGGAAYLMIIALILILAGILFQFLVKHFNRLREYYADAHSAITLRNTRSMQRALARLDLMYKNIKARAPDLTPSNNVISMLFIYSSFIDFFYDPVDTYVEELKKKKTSWLMELLSTHPPIPKRIRFLDRLGL